MSEEFKLPSLGEGVSEADIADIMVAAGDSVEPGQVLMELETEKAVMELPLELPGAVQIDKLLVASGDTVKVGQVLFTYSAGGGASPAPAKAEPKQAESAKEAPAPAAAAPAAAATIVESTGPITFVLPSLGEGVSSADVADLTVSVGDEIAAGQVEMELETKKAVMELPCPHAGEVTEVLVKEGDTIKVGAPLLVIQGVANSAAPAPAAAPAPQQAAAPKAAPAPVKEAVVVDTRSVDASPAATNGTPVPATPSTRRLARELGVDLKRVKGSGSGGRITAEDVQAFVRNQLQAVAKAPSAAVSGGTMVSAGGIAPPPLPDFSRFGEVEREPLNKIARVAAENLTVSWNVIPHVTQYDLADITDLEQARKRFGAGIGKNGPKVTMTAIVMKALATCLKAFPKFNSSLDPVTNEIVYKKYINIGCAVDTPNGLVVPVVKGCDEKSILQIAADITDLATKARDRKLSMDNMQGATCTVTNLGGIGGIGFTPIVNYPEVCILGMSRGQTELKLIDGNVTERLMLPLSLSYDHRVINGADAARFVATLCNLLADPFQLMTTV